MASLYLWSWWPLILCSVVFLAVEIMVVKFAPLKPLNDKQIRRARVLGVAFITAIFILIILAGMFS